MSALEAVRTVSVHHRGLHFAHLYEFVMAYCAAYILAEAKSKLT